MKAVTTGCISRIRLSAVFCWEIFVYYLDTHCLHKHFYRHECLSCQCYCLMEGVSCCRIICKAAQQMLFWDSLKNMTKSSKSVYYPPHSPLLGYARKASLIHKDPNSQLTGLIGFATNTFVLDTKRDAAQATVQWIRAVLGG